MDKAEDQKKIQRQKRLQISTNCRYERCASKSFWRQTLHTKDMRQRKLPYSGWKNSMD